MNRAELLAEQLDGSRDWTLKLVADFSGDEWTYQPDEGMHHALWICGHLAVASNLLVIVRCLGRPAVVDPAFAEHFPIGSPVLGADAHDYPPPETVLGTMARIHSAVLDAIRSIPETRLDEPAYGNEGQPHPHYRTVAGAICHASRHEAFHAGQVAMLRRMLGRPFLR